MNTRWTFELQVFNKLQHPWAVGELQVRPWDFTGRQRFHKLPNLHSHMLHNTAWHTSCPHASLCCASNAETINQQGAWSRTRTKDKAHAQGNFERKEVWFIIFAWDFLRTAEYANIRLEQRQDGSVVKSPSMHPAGFSLPHVEDCQKRIRVYFTGVCLIDTTKAKLVYVHAYSTMVTKTLYFRHLRIR